MIANPTIGSLVHVTDYFLKNGRHKYKGVVGELVHRYGEVRGCWKVWWPQLNMFEMWHTDNLRLFNDVDK